MINSVQFHINPHLSNQEKNIEYSPQQFVEDAIKLICTSKEKKIAIHESIKSFFIDHESDIKREEFIKNVVSIALLKKDEESQLLLSEIILDEFKKGNKSLIAEIVLKNFDVNENLYTKFNEIVSSIISKYNLQDEKLKQLVFFEVIKVLADKDHHKAILSIQSHKKCGIDIKKTTDGQKELIEIVKLIASKPGYNISFNIGWCGIDASTKEGQQGLIEIAKIAAVNTPDKLPIYIKRYKIDGNSEEGQNSLIEIAKMIAKTDIFGLLPKYFKDFGIDNTTIKGQKAIIEIALLASLRTNISENIQNFGIDKTTTDGQKALIALARSSIGGIYSYIQNFGIDGSTEQGQKILIGIAQLSAERDGYNTAKCIKNFGIDESTKESKLALIEIAKIAIRENGKAIEFFKNFGVDSETEEGQKLLIAIAIEEASHNGYSTAQYFKYYKINANSPAGKRAIIEIAEKAVTQNGASSEFIRNFGIDGRTKEGQQIYIKLAKKAAAQNGCDTAKFIKNYGIDSKTEEGKQALIDIARIAIAQHCGAIEYIHNFEISRYDKEHQPILIELAMIGVENNWYINEYIQYFGIDHNTTEGQESLIKIAKKAAEKYGSSISGYISNYKIYYLPKVGQKTLIEIALIAAAKNGQNTSENIHFYGIDGRTQEGQQGLIRIATTSITQNPLATSQYITGYNIKDESIRLRLFLFAYSLNKESSKYIENFKLNKDVQEAWNKDSCLTTSEALFGLDSDNQKLIKILDDDIENKSDEHIRSELFCWLKFVIGSLYQLGIKKLTEQQAYILREIIKYRDPKMRYLLTTSLLELKKDQYKFFEILTKDKNYDYITLPSLLLPHLVNDEKKWSEIILKLQSKALFKDSSAHRPLINTLYQLKITSELAEEDILNLLEKAINLNDKKQTVSNLKMIQGIIGLKGSLELKKDSFNKYKDLSDLYKTLFKQFIPIKEIENFGDKFLNTFFDPRVNSALLVYAGKMKSHKENDKTMKALVTFVETVLEGTFPKNRYDLNNFHLKTIFEGRENTLKLWIEGDKEDLFEAIKSQEPISRNYNKIFIDKIINDKHLDLKKYNHIKSYLEANETERKKIEELLEAETLKLKTEQIKHVEKKEKEKIHEGKIELNALYLQMEIIRLIKGLEEAEQIKTLHRINQLTPKDSEFLNDIKGLINSFEKKEIKDILTLFDTDNYKDLLLCGTEIDGGSCQRVDGDPAFNCGLLAYLLDGKIRLLAIKDKEGKIVARSILRILWDNKNEKPALMMERIYPAVTLPSHNEALMNFAKKRADILGLSLYEFNLSGSVELESLDCPVSWEYVDSAGGISNGKYKITKAVLVS